MEFLRDPSPQWSIPKTSFHSWLSAVELTCISEIGQSYKCISGKIKETVLWL